MKIVFCDVDGILATPKSVSQKMVRCAGHIFSRLDQDCVTAMNHVTDSTGAVFVISSTWRKSGVPALAKHFKNEGVTGTILDRTPQLDSYERGLEILDWLNTHREIDVESFVICDDESDAAHTSELKERFVQTVWRDWEKKGLPEGFTMSHAEKAIKILGGKNVS